ncbi:hypothetical protein AJ80_05458 [Polytolypa hystricis UAMH7299]|uniref:Uncharacterized protein n=1 Tax=Polytolypa hystricis (strain UAMH7299) TaxID=1447883 RepID=A0A2B7Y3C6_POLH7|nr:hypothetical protein AJ80_05458 [Polytolypa hystricis UAMH7299]
MSHAHHPFTHYRTITSSPAESPIDGRRVPTLSGTRCAPTNTTRDDSPDSDTDQAPGRRKRGFGQITSSPYDRHARQVPEMFKAFYTQRCLLGLRQGGLLDDHCPNVKFHPQGGDGSRHLINAEDLVQQNKQQLDKNIDDCTPMGGCGASGAPFKITCAAYGYLLSAKELHHDSGTRCRAKQIFIAYFRKCRGRQFLCSSVQSTNEGNLSVCISS